MNEEPSAIPELGSLGSSVTVFDRLLSLFVFLDPDAGCDMKFCMVVT